MKILYNLQNELMSETCSSVLFYFILNMTTIALSVDYILPTDFVLAHWVEFIDVVNNTVRHELWWLLVHRCLFWKSNSICFETMISSLSCFTLYPHFLYNPSS